MDRSLQTRKLIMDHYNRYPELQIRDILKFLHQSSFGCEHLLSDPSAAVDYIRREAESCCQYKSAENRGCHQEDAQCHRCHQEAAVEMLDGEYCRVHLEYLKKGLSAETFGKLFFLSAQHQEDGREMLEEKLAVLTELVQEKILPFETEDVERAVEKWRSEDYAACHHSEEFRTAYHPAYRVIRKEYVPFLPLFAQIDKMLEQGEVNLAVEGGSASGKSTLGDLLEKVYGCVVLHMDDFFLRPEQRTLERFAEPGGNVDRERFLEEVLVPLGNREDISYRRFDCSTFTVQPPVMIKPSRLTVVEGAYSMHPELAGYYNFSVFLDITPEFQKKRIMKRNSPQFAERFFTEWIPMEHVYFDTMKVKERCDMVIEQRE